MMIENEDNSMKKAFSDFTSLVWKSAAAAFSPLLRTAQTISIMALRVERRRNIQIDECKSKKVEADDYVNSTSKTDLHITEKKRKPSSYSKIPTFPSTRSR